MLVAQKLPPALNSQPSSETPAERLLKRIRRTDDFPTISKYLFEINRKLSANIDSSDASDLSDVILNDYSLTNKLLKLVNSAFYGHAAGKVTTITRAVVILGYENVRLAALSLVLFDKFKNNSNSSDLKEEVIGSFWSGVMSREIAKSNEAIDPEEAFVCSLMSRMGKLAMIHYLPGEYRQIQHQMAAIRTSEAKAVKSVCGMSYDELGMALARQWNFPSQITDAMSPLSEDDLNDENNPPSKTNALTNFVRELNTTIHDKGLSSYKGTFRDLIHRYENLVNISRGQLKTLVMDSIDNVQAHARALNISLGDSLFLKQLSTIKPKSGKPPNSAGIGNQNKRTYTDPYTVDTATVGSTTGDQGMPDAKEIILAGIQEISDTMRGDHDVNDIALMSLEILFRSLRCKRALMFARNGDSRIMNVRFGYGGNAQRLIHSVKWPVGAENDLFNFSIKVGKDLIVPDSYEEKIRNLIPNWYRKNVDAPAFIFLPMLIRGACIGALYADGDEKGELVTAAEHHHLSMLRDQLLLAISHGH